MAGMSLICNYSTCRVTLNTIAWVTSCSHIFCEYDAKRTFSLEKKCPCCNEILIRPLDIVKINLNPDESFKSMVLCGLRPEILMDILLRATNFWNYQMTQEKMIQTTEMKKLQEELEELKVKIETMEHQFQKHMFIETKKTEAALKNAELQRQKVQENEVELIEKRRNLQQVQAKYDSLKLQLISNSNKVIQEKTNEITMAQLQPKTFEMQQALAEFAFGPHIE